MKSLLPASSSTLENMKDWAGLPDDVLTIILEKSKSSIDCLRFRLICRSWRKVIMDRKIKPKIQYQIPIPMLLLPKKKDVWRVYNPSGGMFFKKLEVKIPHNISFSSSSAGWLVAVNEDYTITLHKPCLGVGIGHNQTICLPSLFPPDLSYLDHDFSDSECRSERLFMQEYHVRKIILTADPVLNPKECVVVTIFGRYSKLAFMRYAKDTTWTMLELKKGYELFTDIVYHKNRIYAVNNWNKLVCFDVPEVGDPVITIVTPPLGQSVFTKRYLVETLNGDLLQVVRHKDIIGKRCWTKYFDALIFDVGDCTWKEVESLGDMAIFLGDNTSVALRAYDFHGCQPDCIYFTHDKDSMGKIHHFGDLGVFAYGEQRFYSYTNIGSTALFRMPKRPLWILPIIS